MDVQLFKNLLWDTFLHGQSEYANVSAELFEDDWVFIYVEGIPVMQYHIVERWRRSVDKSPYLKRQRVAIHAAIVLFEEELRQALKERKPLNRTVTHYLPF